MRRKYCRNGRATGDDPAEADATEELAENGSAYRYLRPDDVVEVVWYGDDRMTVLQRYVIEQPVADDEESGTEGENADERTERLTRH